MLIAIKIHCLGAWIITSYPTATPQHKCQGAMRFNVFDQLAQGLAILAL
jgi:hypothetical protein